MINNVAEQNIQHLYTKLDGLKYTVSNYGRDIHVSGFRETFLDKEMLDYQLHINEFVIGEFRLQEKRY